MSSNDPKEDGDSGNDSERKQVRLTPGPKCATQMTQKPYFHFQNGFKLLFGFYNFSFSLWFIPLAWNCHKKDTKTFYWMLDEKFSSESWDIKFRFSSDVHFIISVLWIFETRLARNYVLKSGRLSIQLYGFWSDLLFNWPSLSVAVS